MKKILIITSLSIIFTLVLTNAAFAISNIDNDLYFSDYTLRDGQTTSVTAKTVFGWSYIPNPYPSNYITEINAFQFKKPQTYARKGYSGNWYYRNPGYYVSPAWRAGDKYTWINPTMTVYIKAYVTAKSGSYSRRGNRHGQVTKAASGISWGTPAWAYTRRY